MSPNTSAVANAKKIYSSGSFAKLAYSSDGTFYMGECKGSGKIKLYSFSRFYG